MRRANLWIGAVPVAVVVVIALVSLVWTPHDPEAARPASRLLGSSGEHWLGTDTFGHDVASVLMAGARTTVLVGVVAVAIAAVIGIPLGLLAGLRGGWADAVVGRVTDLLMSFPALLLAIVFAAVFGAGTGSAMVAIGIGAAPGFARVTRASTLRLAATDLVPAALSSGRSWWGVAVRHVLPNVAGMAVVQATVAFSMAVLAEAALSYLGLGTPAPSPSWGRSLHEAQQFLGLQPGLTLWPGAAIAVTVLGLNLLGDGLRDRLGDR